MERLRIDYRESEDCVDVRSVEELLARAFLEGLRMNGRRTAPEDHEPEEQYEDVGDYDPVLRSHCRLD